MGTLWRSYTIFVCLVQLLAFCYCGFQVLFLSSLSSLSSLYSSFFSLSLPLSSLSSLLPSSLSFLFSSFFSLPKFVDCDFPKQAFRDYDFWQCDHKDSVSKKVFFLSLCFLSSSFSSLSFLFVLFLFSFPYKNFIDCPSHFRDNLSFSVFFNYLWS